MPIVVDRFVTTFGGPRYVYERSMERENEISAHDAFTKFSLIDDIVGG
jgi:hypothetical protein